MSEIRVGLGYDVHRLVPGRPLILGGLEIPFEKGLLGHSDADVLLHSITDAVIGALALGDIGSWFPDTDSSFKDIDSSILLKKVISHIKKLGWELGNLDCSVIAEAPKLRPYIDAMRIRVAEIMDVLVDKISIKATTTENLGYIGRGEGIAAEVIVLLKKN